MIIPQSIDFMTSSPVQHHDEWGGYHERTIAKFGKRAFVVFCQFFFNDDRERGSSVNRHVSKFENSSQIRFNWLSYQGIKMYLTTETYGYVALASLSIYAVLVQYKCTGTHLQSITRKVEIKMCIKCAVFTPSRFCHHH